MEQKELATQRESEMNRENIMRARRGTDEFFKKIFHEFFSLSSFLFCFFFCHIIISF